MAWTLTVDGTDVLDFVRAGSLSIHQAAYDSGTMGFVLVGAPGDFAVDNEMEVVWANGGTTYFGGYTRQVKRAEQDRPGNIIVDVQCQDYSSLLGDDVVDGDGLRLSVETDQARIEWLLSTYGTKGVTTTHVASNVASCPPQDFTGTTLNQAVSMVLALSGGFWYVDYDKDLHAFTSEGLTAPHGLSDAPNDTTTFGYNDLLIPTETTGLRNAVYCIPGTGDAVPTWYTDAGSIAAYGRRATVLQNSQVTRQATLDRMGAAYLAANAHPQVNGSLVTYEPGLAAGQTFQLTNADYSLSAVTYRITAIETTFPAKQNPEYKVDFGDRRISLNKTFADPKNADSSGGGDGGSGGSGGGTGGTGGYGGGVGGGYGDGYGGSLFDWQSAIGEGGITIAGTTGNVWAVWANTVTAFGSPTVTGGHFLGPGLIVDHDYQGILIQEADTTTIAADPGGEVDVWLVILLSRAQQDDDGNWSDGNDHHQLGDGTGAHVDPPETVTVIDDFSNRSITVAPESNTGSTAGWGTPSNWSENWYTLAPSSDSKVGVISGEGVITIVGDDSIQANFSNDNFGNPIPSQLAEGQTWSFDLWCDQWENGLGAPGAQIAYVDVTLYTPQGNGSFRLYGHDDAVHGTIEGTPSNISIDILSVSTWYTVKMRNTLNFEVKIWEVGTTEPTDWIVAYESVYSSAPPWTPDGSEGLLLKFNNSPGASLDTHFKFDNFVAYS